MAAETTGTTITSAVNAEYIEPLMLSYAIDAVVAIPRLRVSNLAGRGTKTASFWTTTKDTAADLTEATDASNTAQNLTDVTVACAEIGIVRDVTKLAKRSFINGEAELMSWLAEEGGVLCMEEFEKDVWGIFSDASSSVGTSGQPMTLSNVAQALSTLGTNKAFGKAVFMLSTKQAQNLRDAVVTGAAQFLGSGAANGVLQQTAEDGYVGNFLGTEIFQSSLAESSGDDKIGCCMVDGAAKPQQSPIGLAVLWWPEVESILNPSLRSEEMAVTMCAGEAEVLDYAYCKIVTVA